MTERTPANFGAIIICNAGKGGLVSGAAVFNAKAQ